jgi:hypothetical protein
MEKISNPLKGKMPQNWMLMVVIGVIGYLLYRNIHRSE